MAQYTLDHLKYDGSNDIWEITDSAARGSLAAAYSASSTYAVGDIVLKDGQLYKCNTAITTAEAWNAAHWTAVTVGENIADLGAETNTLKEDYTTLLDSAYVTDTASGAIASFPDGADNVPVKSLTVDIEPVQSGSGDPSPTNIRPISGHTQAVVTRTRKNLLNAQNYVSLNNSSIDANGVVTATASDSRAFSPVLQLWLDSTFVGLGTKISNTKFEFTKNASFNRIVFGHSGASKDIKIKYDVSALKEGQTYIFTETVISSQNPISWKDMMIRPASDTDDTYEPYNGNTYTIDLDGTRYGGILDVTTGVLTVDRAMVDLGSLTWTYYTSGTYPILYAEPSGHRAYVNGEHTDAICENYSEGNPAAARSTLASGNLPDKSFSWISGASGSFTVRDSSYTSAAAFKAAMDGVKLVYPLATPFTIQLTANEISTVLGQNNIWSDAGDVEVEYRADTKLYIEKLTAPTEDDMIADHAISANSFFMVGNTLYRATTAIASGATITVGTNATKLSLSEALNALA